MVTRKEREKLARKQEIMDAALRLFATKGYKATTLDEIAEESEFGKGTLYNYFTSKEDIYVEIIRNTLEDHNRFILSTDRTKQSLYDFIFEIMKKLLTFSCRNRAAHLLMIFTEIHLSHTNLPKIKKLLEDNQEVMNKFFVDKAKKAIKSGEIRNIDPQKAIKLFRGIFSNYIYDLTLNDQLIESSIDDEALFLTDILFNGIKKN